jgi:outer membrane lipoprotein SlyB
VLIKQERDIQEGNMEASKPANRIHPLMAGAAVSVMVVSLVGVAAITGLIPNSHGISGPATAFGPTAAPAIATAASSPAALVDPKSQPKLAATDIHGAPDNSAVPSTATSPDYSPRATQGAQSKARSGYSNGTPVAQAPAVCQNCGRVESVQTIQKQVKPSGVGIAAGAVLGGVLGNQVGSGNGRTLATVAGAVGGGYAGNEVEKRTRTTTSYDVRVRMEDGRIRHFPYTAQPGWHTGDRVRVVDGKLVGRG